MKGQGFILVDIFLSEFKSKCPDRNKNKYKGALVMQQ